MTINDGGVAVRFVVHGPVTSSASSRIPCDQFKVRLEPLKLKPSVTAAPLTVMLPEPALFVEPFCNVHVAGKFAGYVEFSCANVYTPGVSGVPATIRFLNVSF